MQFIFRVKEKPLQITIHLQLACGRTLLLNDQPDATPVYFHTIYQLATIKAQSVLGENAAYSDGFIYKDLLFEAVYPDETPPKTHQRINKHLSRFNQKVQQVLSQLDDETTLLTHSDRKKDGEVQVCFVPDNIIIFENDVCVLATVALQASAPIEVVPPHDEQSQELTEVTAPDPERLLHSSVQQTSVTISVWQGIQQWLRGVYGSRFAKGFALGMLGLGYLNAFYQHTSPATVSDESKPIISQALIATPSRVEPVNSNLQVADTAGLLALSDKVAFDLSSSKTQFESAINLHKETRDPSLFSELKHSVALMSDQKVLSPTSLATAIYIAQDEARLNDALTLLNNATELGMFSSSWLTSRHASILHQMDDWQGLIELIEGRGLAALTPELGTFLQKAYVGQGELSPVQELNQQMLQKVTELLHTQPQWLQYQTPHTLSALALLAQPIETVDRHAFAKALGRIQETDLVVSSLDVTTTTWVLHYQSLLIRQASYALGDLTALENEIDKQISLLPYSI